MAIPHLTDEEIRTWTPEQKDRWWLENVYRGDMPQLTLRSAVTGFLLGGVLCATNLYIGAKTGWSLGVGVTSVILSFLIFKILSGSGLAKDLTILENNCVQSIATAAGYMTGPLISALAAYMFITNEPMPWHQILIWNVVASILGVLVAFPMKRRFINNEQQPFPEGRACAVVLDSLYPHAPAGGTRNMASAAAAKAAEAAAAAAGMFKAYALLGAALVAGVLQFFTAAGYMGLIQVKGLGIAKTLDEVWKIPERLDSVYFWLAAKLGLPLPTIGGLPVAQLAITPTFDLAMVGAGGLMGLRIANSLLIGCVVNYFLIAPIMIGQGEILPRNISQIVQPDGSYPMAEAIFGRAHILNNWCLWWGVTMMVVASLTGLFARPKMIISAFTGVFTRKADSEDCLRTIEFPLWVSLTGVPLMTVVVVLMNYFFFDINPWLGLLSIPLIILLTLIAANATALTATTPTGALSKITQFTFGAIQPTNPATNLITAGVTTEVAGNASNLLMDIKPGYMLGAKPRQQAWGHVIGIFSGALASTPLFYLLFLWRWKPGGETIEAHITETGGWAMPGALQWSAVARVIGAMGASGTDAQGLVQTGADGIARLWGVVPVSAAWSMVVAAVVALVFESMRIATRSKFPLSAVAIGLGVVIPPESTFMMWIGAAIFTVLEHRNRKRPKESTGYRLWVDGREAVCAGLIAGWALMGIGDGIIGALVDFPH